MDTNTPISQTPSQQSPSSIPPQMSSGTDTPHTSKVLLISILVGVLILLAFGAYSLRSAWVAQDDEAALQAEQARDSVASIESDLNTANIDNLDKELESIDAELNASVQ